MTSVAIFFDIDDGRFLLPVKSIHISSYGPPHKLAAMHKNLVLTIMRIPFSPSVVVSCKAEHRNSDDDGQDNVRSNNGHYRLHVYQVTGTTFCERAKTLD